LENNDLKSNDVNKFNCFQLLEKKFLAFYFLCTLQKCEEIELRNMILK